MRCGIRQGRRAERDPRPSLARMSLARMASTVSFASAPGPCRGTHRRTDGRLCCDRSTMSAMSGTANRISSRDVPCGRLVTLLRPFGARTSSWCGTDWLPAWIDRDCSGEGTSSCRYPSPVPPPNHSVKATEPVPTQHLVPSGLGIHNIVPMCSLPANGQRRNPAQYS